VRSIAVLVVLAAVAIAGCGDDGDASGDGAQGDLATSEDTATSREKPTQRPGATITLQDSDFGPMLSDSNEQAIYVFERDGRDESVCYGGCAEAWPPVFTAAVTRRPVAGLSHGVCVASWNPGCEEDR
jgi:hypothetical protein